jgi:glutamyl-Q tRNA(Asp) synthetase
LGEHPARFDDRLLGTLAFDPAALGDVVLKRKDNTPWQRQLQRALGYPRPRYLHLPLMVSAAGQKLSKQNFAPMLADDARGVRRQLFDALTALDQAPPAELAQGTPHEQLAWGIAHWSTARLATAPTRPAPQEV